MTGLQTCSLSESIERKPCSPIAVGRSMCGKDKRDKKRSIGTEAIAMLWGRSKWRLVQYVQYQKM